MYTPTYKHTKEKYYCEIILSMLPNEPCRINSRDLAANTGLKSRDVRFVIQKLRDAGHPICATPEKGYWIAQYSSDMNDTINKLKSHISNVQATLDALLEAQQKLKDNERGGYHDN